MKHITAIVLLLLLLSTVVYSKEIKICSDENYWYPFSYKNEANEAEGLHVDMLVHILEELGYDFTITPLPWKRCLHEAETGKYDAVLNASFKPERAVYLHYPENGTPEETGLYLTKVEYVVVSHNETDYTFDGDIMKLPTPVRGVLGYSILDDLSIKGVSITNGRNVRENFESLIRSKRGVVVTTPNTALALLKEMNYGNSLTIHETLLASKAYYVTFSKAKKNITPEERKAIWEECAKLRSNEQFMDSLYLKYEKQAEKKNR